MHKNYKIRRKRLPEKVLKIKMVSVMQRMWEIYFDWKYVLEINYGIKNDICIFYILFIMQEADFRSSLSTCNLY